MAKRRLTKTEHRLKNNYYRDRSVVAGILDTAELTAPQKKQIERFWWYRDEDDEISRERSFRERMGATA